MSEASVTAESSAFWGTRLRGVTAPTPMFVDRNTGKPAGVVAQAHRILGEQDTLAIERFLRDHELALHHLARTAWAVLLYRYGAEGAVLFGVDTGSRVQPFCVELSLADSARTTLARIMTESGELLRHEISLEAFRSCAGIPRDMPLFESLVQTSHDLGGSRRDGLTLTVTGASRFEFRATYPVSRFEPVTIERLLGHFEALLLSMVREPDRALQQLDVLSIEERQQILFDWNATDVPFPDTSCLHVLFERHVKENPDSIAVIVDGVRLTYGELNERANRVAHKLIELGVRPETPVGICIERTLDMPAGVLGILKSGCAYVPLDPSYPRDRLAFMIEDTDVPVLVTQRSLVPNLPDCAATILCVDDAAGFADCSNRNPDINVTPEHLSYLIFTSGSTGRPKGVMVDHRGRVSNFHDFNRRFEIGPGDKVLAVSSLSFDMSAYDLLGTFMAGATAVIVRDDEKLEPSRWAELIKSHEVTIWHSVPALLDMLLRHTESRPQLFPSTLRVILLGGDWIPVTLPGRLWDQVPDARVISLGGATEVSMDSTIYEVKSVDQDWKSIPYGKPMANQRAYLLDKCGAPVPIGVPGELYLGGIGVGRGYHNRAELSAEKFLDNPWVDGERVYRTGDLARWREDGNLELLGRVDFQVKVRGHRIELGEIETALREHPLVQEAVVLAVDRPTGERQLVAYVLEASDAVDARVREAGHTQVEHWAEVFNAAYCGADGQQDAAFKIASWDSSYTRAPLPADHVREWVDQTVARIRDERPSRVLEIGCGTGLLLFRLAPDADRYMGTDISRTGLDHIGRHLGELNLAGRVSLELRAAHDFGSARPREFDAVVLNSIVQNFPSAEYLLDVLDRAIETLEDGGFVFIGDVRSRPRERAFRTSVAVHLADSHATVQSVRAEVERRMRMEEELVIDPELFVSMQRRSPRIAHVSIRHKRGACRNEMTNYRYDVVLRVGGIATEGALEWRDFATDVRSLERLESLLAAAPDELAVRGMRDARTRSDVCLLQAIAAALPSTLVRDVRAAAEAEAAVEPGIDPDALYSLADRIGYTVHVRDGRDAAGGELVAVFRRGLNREMPTIPVEYKEVPLRACTNEPLRAQVVRSLGRELRSALEARLPSYMVPAAFVVLEAFPLNPNGKINRRAFPTPDTDRPDVHSAFIPPEGPLEGVVAGIWAGVLEVAQVGRHDRFLELGGSSLLAVQARSRIQDLFEVEVRVNTILTLPFDEFSAELVLQARAAGVDAHGIAAIYQSIATLSEEQVISELHERNVHEA